MILGLNSCKWTALLMATLTKPGFNSNTNCVFISYKRMPRTLSGFTTYILALFIRSHKFPPEMKSQSPMNLVLKYINFKPLFFTKNLYWFQFWFFQIHFAQLHFERPLEFYPQPLTIYNIVWQNNSVTKHYKLSVFYISNVYL